MASDPSMDDYTLGKCFHLLLLLCCIISYINIYIVYVFAVGWPGYYAVLLTSAEFNIMM